MDAAWADECAPALHAYERIAHGGTVQLFGSTGACGPIDHRAPANSHGATFAAREVAPLSPGRNALRVTIDDETADLFEKAKDRLSHTSPNADAGAVLKRALQCLVLDLERRKFAKVEHPRTAKGASASSRVSAKVQRQVRARDGDACRFESADGQRCGSRHQLEWDHRQPPALGGRWTTENVRQLCRAHNQYEAERRFGRGFMARKRGERAQEFRPP